MLKRQGFAVDVVAREPTEALEPGWTTAVVPGGQEMRWTHPHDLLHALSTCIAREPRAPRNP